MEWRWLPRWRLSGGGLGRPRGLRRRPPRGEGCGASSGGLFLPPGGEQREVRVSKQEAKLLVQDLDPSRDYHFQIFALRGSEHSKPLQARHRGERGPSGGGLLLLWRP